MEEQKKKEEQKQSYQLTQQEIDQLMQEQPELEKQSYEQIPELTPLSTPVISRQATINIGTIGHVAHGKSTLVRAISGVHTVKFKQEKIRNITIRLGYANAKIYQCPKCEGPKQYKSYPSNMKDTPNCEDCKVNMKLLRHVSFVDCPGHDILMSTMLTGAAVMDCCLLLIAGNMQCPQPQTNEHMRAVIIMNLKHIIIIQNKVDIIYKEEEKAQENFKEIKKFIKDVTNTNHPIIPCSAQLKYNVDVVLQKICEYFPIPIRDLKSSPKMIIIRSFDVNHPGERVDKLQGGVVGGSIIKGVLKIGDEVEIRPGIIQRDQNGGIKCIPIFSRIVTLKAENNKLLYAVPGGLIGVGLMVDPSITRNDRLVGNVLGHPNQLMDIFKKIEIQFFLLRKLITKTESSSDNRVAKITKGEQLKFNVGSTETPGMVVKVKEELKSIVVELTNPICTQIGEKVAFCRRIDKKFRLIGWGDIISGDKF